MIEESPVLEALKFFGFAVLMVLFVACALSAWLENRRQARQATATHSERYDRFLRFLSTVRDARRQG
jgi:hypothetical protein